MKLTLYVMTLKTKLCVTTDKTSSHKNEVVVCASVSTSATESHKFESNPTIESEIKVMTIKQL